MLYHFYIELAETESQVWRRIIVPAEINLYELHMAIQAAFGWTNSHLFQFSRRDMMDEVSYQVIYPHLDEVGEVIDVHKTKMKKIFCKPGDHFSYIYDFGDHWQHEVRLEKIEDKENMFYCTGGKGACPPEDVGGVYGSQNMLQILKTRKHPERKNFIQWLNLEAGEKWDPVFCSVSEINKRMVLLNSLLLKD